MSPAIELTTYTYSDTNGHEAMAPMAGISQSGSLRPALLVTNWVTGQAPEHDGEREAVDGRAGASHDGRVRSENGRKRRKHDRNAAEEGEIDQSLFRQPQMRDQFHPVAPLASDASVVVRAKEWGNIVPARSGPWPSAARAVIPARF